MSRNMTVAFYRRIRHFVVDPYHGERKKPISWNTKGDDIMKFGEIRHEGEVKE